MKQIISIMCIWVFLSMALCADAQEPVWRVTEEEAALPDRVKNKLQSSQGLVIPHPEVNREEMARPFIHVEAPDENKLYKELIDILIRFEKNPLGEPVNMSSLRVIYQKFFDIDITDRVLPYVKENQVDAAKIKFPKGEHKVKVFIKDNENMESSRLIKVTVKS